MRKTAISPQPIHSPLRPRKPASGPNRRFELGLFPRHPCRPLTVPLGALRRHALILGGTGQGKSKLLEHILRALLHSGLGFEFHEPHGDLSDDVMEYLSINPGGVIPQDVIERIVYVEPGRPDNCVSFDVFAQYPGQRYDGPEYVAWLETTVRHVQRVVQKLQGDDSLEGMARLGRWLRVMLIGAGIAVDDHGTHLGLSDALVLLTPQDDRHEEAFRRIEPRLCRLFPDVYYDLVKLRETKRAIDQERWTESTFNRFLPLVTAPAVRFMTGQYRRSLNVRDLYRRDCALLLNLRPSDYFSRDQAIAVSGFFQFAFDAVARSTPEHERRERPVLIDEMEHFLDGSTRDLLGEGRKFRRAVIGCAQDTSCLRNDRIDHLAKWVSQAGVVISFQQKAPDDLEYLGQFFASPNFDFTPLKRIVDRPEQHWILVPSVSFGTSEQTGRQLGVSRSVSNTISGQRTHTDSTSESESVTRSRQHARGRNWSEARGTARADSHTRTWNDTTTESSQHSVSVGHGETESDTDSRGRSDTSITSESIGSSRGDGRTTQLRSPSGDVLSRNTGFSRSASEGSSSAESHSEAHTKGRTRNLTVGDSTGTARAASDGGSSGTTHTDSFTRSSGGSETDTDGIAKQQGSSRGRSDARGIALAHAQGQSRSAGVSETSGVTESVSYQLQQITWHREEHHPTGKLLKSVPDQIAMVQHVLSTLPTAHVLMRCNDTQTFLLRIATLADPCQLAGRRPDVPRTAAYRRLRLEQFKKRLFAQHPFSFNPLSAENEPSPVERFIAGLPRSAPALPDDGNGHPRPCPGGNGHKPPPTKRTADALYDSLPPDHDEPADDPDPEDLIG